MNSIQKSISISHISSVVRAARWWVLVGSSILPYATKEQSYVSSISLDWIQRLNEDVRTSGRIPITHCSFYYSPIAQLVRVRHWYCRGRWFESSLDYNNTCSNGGTVDTLVLETSAERRVGSNPTWSTIGNTVALCWNCWITCHKRTINWKESSQRNLLSIWNVNTLWAYSIMVSIRNW